MGRRVGRDSSTLPGLLFVDTPVQIYPSGVCRNGSGTEGRFVSSPVTGSYLSRDGQWWTLIVVVVDVRSRGTCTTTMHLEIGGPF